VWLIQAFLIVICEKLIHRGGDSGAIPEERQGHIMVWHKGDLYVHGGRTHSQKKGQRNFVDDLWRYAIELHYNKMFNVLRQIFSH
jgi:hypothetical protein